MAEHSALPPASAPSEALEQAGDLLEVGVVTTDAGLVVRGWNRWLQAATGWTAAEVIGRPLLELFPELAGSRAEDAFRRALEGETVVFAHRFHEHLLPLSPATGFEEEFGRMQQSARIVPLMAGDRIEGAVALIQDVTERVARERELKRAMDQAREASQAKSDFLAAMSHELRTPLNGVVGYADLLLGEISGPLLEAQRQQVQRIKAGAWHLISIIEGILLFSRTEAGKEEVYPEPFDAVQLASDAAALLEPEAIRKGLDLRVALPADSVVLQTDPRKVRQILLNLLGNAVKFTDAGEVELHLWMEEGVACFRVRDTGPGIGDADQERIFEPFTRLEDAQLHKGGTGLGLPVSRKLARLLGGELMLEGTQTRGSCFTLRLPARLERSPLSSSTAESMETVSEA